MVHVKKTDISGQLKISVYWQLETLLQIDRKTVDWQLENFCRKDQHSVDIYKNSWLAVRLSVIQLYKPIDSGQLKQTVGWQLESDRQMVDSNQAGN